MDAGSTARVADEERQRRNALKVRLAVDEHHVEEALEILGDDRAREPAADHNHALASREAIKVVACARHAAPRHQDGDQAPAQAGVRQRLFSHGHVSGAYRRRTSVLVARGRRRPCSAGTGR